ncbi:expressed unknown protein [Seminavis robusta]|uniref:Uncharacterized protein n=1 Tax=Seminavis robusta TaxID=568900 RepID=A0A9N8EPN2_9STRA|nr:expressed unknown protein [Seminavis robusta]|eukprot:Sro1711_g292840.1 n/a (212) ;mRNA; f:14868-15503
MSTLLLHDDDDQLLPRIESSWSINNLDDESTVFLRRIQKGILLLGFELGFLVQASTANIQYIFTTSFVVFDRTSQLILSFVWSYVVAIMALITFYSCQRVVFAFLHDSVMRPKHPSHLLQDQRHPPLFLRQYQVLLLEDWKVEFRCQFVQGSLVGVLCSWVFLDVILNFRIRVVYGGILYLCSLLLVMQQMYGDYCQLPLCEPEKEHEETV